ncbi:hypothetical protein [Desulfitobacterium sp.]|uniref:hypothetical protein n=1 Tax=Desulfitobacterium sp. TaxID=49981 RepID=UPI002CE7E4ED|nr:hypothetical protein [Desulfitobacterium sp.]HVJ49590.1 hypothetical protein [Desulfitobacterium sp.]
MSVIEVIPDKTLGKVWSRHGGVIITALCLGFIILAWYHGQDGKTGFVIFLYLLAYAIGGYHKAWEGLQTLFKEKELDVDLLMVVAELGQLASVIGKMGQY